MLAIHGVWSDGQLSLWAEDSDQLRPMADRELRPMHPFAAATDLLAEVLAEFGDAAGDLVCKATETEVTLWLPATAAGPLASPDHAEMAAEQIGNGRVPAIAASAGRPSRVALRPWQVPAASFDPLAALGLLTALSQPGARSERGVLAGSVQFLIAVASLAADLTTRGRVLPGLDDVQDSSYSGSAGRLRKRQPRCQLAAGPRGG